MRAREREKERDERTRRKWGSFVAVLTRLELRNADERQICAHAGTTFFPPTHPTHPRGNGGDSLLPNLTAEARVRAHTHTHTAFFVSSMPPPILPLSSPSTASAPAWAAIRFALVPAGVSGNPFHHPSSSNIRAQSWYRREAAVRALLNPDRYEHAALRCAAWVPSPRVRCSVRTPNVEGVCAALSGPVHSAMSSLFGVAVRVRNQDCFFRSRPFFYEDDAAHHDPSPPPRTDVASPGLYPASTPSESPSPEGASLVVAEEEVRVDEWEIFGGDGPVPTLLTPSSSTPPPAARTTTPPPLSPPLSTPPSPVRPHAEEASREEHVVIRVQRRGKRIEAEEVRAAIEPHTKGWSVCAPWEGGLGEDAVLCVVAVSSSASACDEWIDGRRARQLLPEWLAGWGSSYDVECTPLPSLTPSPPPPPPPLTKERGGVADVERVEAAMIKWSGGRTVVCYPLQEMGTVSCIVLSFSPFACSDILRGAIEDWPSWYVVDCLSLTLSTQEREDVQRTPSPPPPSPNPPLPPHNPPPLPPFPLAAEPATKWGGGAHAVESNWMGPWWWWWDAAKRVVSRWTKGEEAVSSAWVTVRVHVRGEMARWGLKDVQLSLEDAMHAATGGGALWCGRARKGASSGDVVCTVQGAKERSPEAVCNALRTVVVDEVHTYGGTFFAQGGGSEGGLWWMECVP